MIKLEIGVLNHSTTLIYSETNQHHREAQQNLLWCFFIIIFFSKQKIHTIIVYKLIKLMFIELLFKKKCHVPSRVVLCCLYK